MSAVRRVTVALVCSKDARVEANSRASTTADMVAISAVANRMTSFESPARWWSGTLDRMNMPNSVLPKISTKATEAATRAGIYSAFPIVDVARQDLALADMIGGADDALALHAFDDAGGPVVADLQVALDEAGAALALTRHQGNRLVV